MDCRPNRRKKDAFSNSFSVDAALLGILEGRMALYMEFFLRHV